MLQSKLFTLFTVILFMSGVGVVDCVVAGEKFEATSININTNFQSIKIDDEGNHFIGVFENKIVYFDKKTGEKSTGISKGIMDMNLKTGKGMLNGYTVRTFTNGDQMFTSWEGKPVAKGHSQGTFSYTGGTGKFEGLTGEGTWDSRTLAPGISYNEAKGERVYKE